MIAGMAKAVLYQQVGEPNERSTVFRVDNGYTI